LVAARFSSSHQENATSGFGLSINFLSTRSRPLGSFFLIALSETNFILLSIGFDVVGQQHRRRRKFL
jgi:hypothetical protein